MQGLNRQLDKMLLKEQLTAHKIDELKNIKPFVDRLAQTSYVAPKEREELEAKFGVAPDIITWGDYFQTQIASEHWEKDDDEFSRLMQTVTFDIIAATLIFYRKSEQFYEQVHEQAILASEKASDEQTDEDLEALHLGILARYASEMQLHPAGLSESDLAFFEQFSEQLAS